MSIFEMPENLKLLRNLLNPTDSKDDGSDLEDECQALAKQNFDPGSIGPQQSNNANKSKKSFQSPYALIADDEKSDNAQTPPTTIEEWQQQQEKYDSDILDSRKCPSYSVTYRQAVGTQDIYLQMSNRSNASASCEDMLVDILLPDETTPADKMQLSITASEVDLATPLYRLKLPLSQPVNVDRCGAKYDRDLQKLTLTLRLQRELDFVNF